MGILDKWFGPPDVAALEKRRSIGKLIAASAHKEPNVRKLACESLGRLGDVSATSALIAVLDSKSNRAHTDVRVAAYEALSKLNSSVAVLPLLQIAITDTSISEGLKKTASRALEELTRSHPETVVERLISTVLNTNSAPDLRVAACEALGKMNRPEAIQPLLQITNTVDWVSDNLQKAAIQALKGLAQSYPEPVVEALGSDSQRVRDLACLVLSAMPDPPYALLIAAINGGGRARHGAVDILRRRPERGAVEPLIEALTAEDGELRRKVASALAATGDARAVEPLIQVLRDPNRKARAEAASALGRLGDSRAVEPLLVALANDAEVTAESAGALGQLRDPRAVEPLIKALGDAGASDGPEISTIASALGQLGDRRAVRPLIMLVTSGVAWVHRDTVATALGELGDASAVAPLIAMLKQEDESLNERSAPILSRDRHYKVIDAVMFALVRLREPEGIRAVIERLDSPISYDVGDRDDCQTFYPVQRTAEAAIRQLGEAAVEPLLSALSDESVRRPAMRMLSELGDHRAVQALIAQLANTPGYATTALARIGDHRAVSPLIALRNSQHAARKWKEREEVEEALAQLGGPQVVDFFIGTLNDPTYYPAFALEALQRLKDPRAVEPLMVFLNEVEHREYDGANRWCLFAAAVSALKALGWSDADRAIADYWARHK